MVFNAKFVWMKKTNALRILDRNKITYETIEYTYNSERLAVDKIARDNDLALPLVYKTLVAKGDKTGIIVAVIPGQKELNFKALAKASGNKKITLVQVKELLELTGYIRGGCSPIGMKKAYPVFIDQDAAQEEIIYVNAGQRGLLFGAKPEDIRKVSRAIFAEIGS